MCSAVVCYNSTWWLSSAGLHLTALPGLWSQCWITAMAQFFSLITLHLSHTHSNPTCLTALQGTDTNTCERQHYPEQINHSLFAFKVMCKVTFKPSSFLLVNKANLYEQLKHKHISHETHADSYWNDWISLVENSLLRFYISELRYYFL